MIAREKLSKLWLVVVVPLVLLLPVLTAAQTATLQGRVTDATTGEALPGANVVVSSSGGAMTGAATDVNGNYTVKSLSAGTYTVTVSFIGYEKKSVSVTLGAGASETMNFTINPSGISLNETVVSASRVEEKVLNAPAAISILEATEIRQMVSPSSQMILANTTGVDMAKTGIDREEIVLRGFNNAFSGATYVLTDYRQAAVASLGVNLHSIMPNTAIDLERVEVVRGPGSALYGAGVAAGVIHYITKNPFSYPGTTVSVGGGERSSYYGSFRHAGVLSSKVGYKITGQYGQADDWQLDPNDPEDQAQLANDVKPRNYDYLKYNLNGYLQYRFNDRTTLSAAGGYSSLDATVLSGIGTVQADNFGYSYGQLRLQSGSFFAQTYVNRNEAGDSFVYGTGDKVTDASILFNAQAQYDFNMSQGRHKVIVGADFDLIRPDTKGTIYGRNENDDKIQEFGGYVQTTSALTSKLDATLALRGDYNDVQEDFQISPRVALVLKATPEHTFRATYNRAFSSPGNNSQFLDIVGQRQDFAPGISIVARAQGNAKGFTFNNARSGGGLTGSATIPVPGFFGTPVRYANGPGVPTQNIPLAAVYGVVYGGLAATPVEELQQRLAAAGINLPAPAITALIQLLHPSLTRVSGIGSSALDRDAVDGEPLKPTITQTLEAGYKGLLSGRILFAVDAYYSKAKDFVGPVLRESPLAFLTNIDGELTPALAQAIAANPQLNGALMQFGISPATAAGVVVNFAKPDLQRLPVSVVQPDHNQVPGEIFATYRNFGNVDYYGVDASMQINASNHLNLFGNISYVSDDFFDNKELDETNTSLELALNAPKFKAKGGFSYNIPLGFGFNAAGRYSKGFPVRSGPYIGDVESYFLLDVGAGYDLGRYAPGMSFDVMVQNLLDKEHREFIGAPKIGRLALARLNYTF
ncbi:MAG: TonB-dependent receptor domain-containing protein [bacterium]